MNKALKKNLPVILAFALPMLLIGAIGLSAYVPSLFLQTNYNFIYATCGSNSYDYRCSDNIDKRFSVEGGILTTNTLTPRTNDNITVEDLNTNFKTKLYLHDTELNESREITLEEAQQLQLNGLSSSPDGFIINNGYSNRVEVFPFYSSSSRNGWYLTKGSKRKKMYMLDSNYYRNYHFVGWVEPGRTN